MSRQNHRSRSKSGVRRGTPFPMTGYRVPQLDTIAILVQIINSHREGRLPLRFLGEALIRRGVFNSTQEAIPGTWEIVINNSRNFLVDELQTSPLHVTGNEVVWVKTSLALCETHCRKGKGVRNRDCRINCGALHVCRTFLLMSEDACPFNTHQKKCFFGHAFQTQHNMLLLEENHLHMLKADELQTLFRRRFSRTPTTMPQICIYYNNPNGKRCENKHCKSLHLCESFVQERCGGGCPRNHSLASKQVKSILLNTFAIDWHPEQVLQDIQKFHRSRARNNSESDASEDHGSISDESDGLMGRDEEDFYSHSGSDKNGERWMISEDSVGDKEHTCRGCKELKAEMERHVLYLKSEIQQLNQTVEGLRQKLQQRDSREQTRQKLLF